MSESMLVSIITPCLNAEKTIRKTIESVLNQTYHNIEYWIIDGQSTDRTLEIIKEYQDDRIHLISEKDDGIYDAMNKGIRHASGEIVGIINSDDWYEPDSVAYAVSHHQDGKYNIQYGLMNEYNGNKCYMTWICYHNNLDNKMIPHPTCFVDREIYRKYGGYDTKFPICADREFMMRCVRKDDIQFLPHLKVLANFMDGGMSTNSRLSERIALEFLDLKLRYGLMNERTYKKKQVTTRVYYWLKKMRRG